MTTQAVSFDGMCGCTDPVYISMRTGEEEGLGPAPLSYPVIVYNVDGDVITFGDESALALDKAEYIDIWNSDPVNQAVGTLGDLMGDTAPFSFILRLNDDQTAPDFVRGSDGDTIFDWIPGNVSPKQVGIGATDSGVLIVSWGDGTLEAVDLADLTDGIMTHDYDVQGKYQVKIWNLSAAIDTLDVSENEATLFDVLKYADTINAVIANDNSLWRFSATNFNQSATLLKLGNNQLTSFDSSNLPAAMIDIEINDNNIPTADVEALLAKLVSSGLSNGDVEALGQTPNTVPTAGITASATTLRAESWTVNVDGEAL